MFSVGKIFIRWKIAIERSVRPFAYQVTYDYYQVTCDYYQVTCDYYQVTCDYYQVTCDYYQMTCDYYQVTCDYYQVTCDSSSDVIALRIDDVSVHVCPHLPFINSCIPNNNRKWHI